MLFRPSSRSCTNETRCANDQLGKAPHGLQLSFHEKSAGLTPNPLQDYRSLTGESKVNNNMPPPHGFFKAVAGLLALAANALGRKPHRQGATCHARTISRSSECLPVRCGPCISLNQGAAFLPQPPVSLSPPPWLQQHREKSGIQETLLRWLNSKGRNSTHPEHTWM